MDDRYRAELERILRQQAQAGMTPQVQRQVAEASRALSQRAFEAAQVSKQMNPVVRRVGEMYSAEVRRMMPQLTQMAQEVAAAQVERAQRPIRAALAVQAGLAVAQAVEISRQLQRTAAAQIANASIPRVEVFRPTLDRLVAQMEVAYPRYLPPEPAGGGTAPAPPLEDDVLAPYRLERFLSDLALQNIAKSIIVLLVMAILWQSLTGQWIFEPLLNHLGQQIEQIEQADPPIDPDIGK